MTGNETFKFYTDPGHGWMAVKRTFLQELGIESKITFYSYQKGGTVYLEEDCDATTFFKAYEAKFGHPPKYESKYSNNTPIRNYSHYQPFMAPSTVSGTRVRNSIKDGQIITLSARYGNRKLVAWWRGNTLTGSDGKTRYRLGATVLEGATVTQP